MRNAILFLFVFVLTSFVSQAQDDLKLGIKAAPIIGTNRAFLDDADTDIENGSGYFNFSLGLIVDKFFGDSYAFSTGLIYLPREVTMDVSSAANTFNEQETYKLQYLQVPVTVKLFTNEVMPDGKIYFQLGGAVEVKIFQQGDEELTEPTIVSKFQPINLPVIIGTGLEYRAGLNTILIAGLSYQRGLNNQIGTTNFEFDEELSIRSSVFSIDLGIKF